LNKKERKLLIDYIDQLDFLKSEDDQLRLNKLKERIRDSNCISLQSRNERIASSISEELSLDYNETLETIKFVSHVRGTHLHDLRIDEKNELREAENKLKKILKSYIQKNI
jgi:hypothetical protein